MGEGKRECHPGRISKAFLPACTACVFLVFSLTRFINIGRSLWTDEASQVLDSMRPLSEVAFAAARQTMMPLDFWIIHFAVDLFGHNAFAYRFSSLLFSHLTALIVFLFVRRICRNAWPALLAVLILSCNGQYLVFSQEVRPYSLTIFFVLWIYYIGCSFYRKPRFRDFLALLACTSLGFMGHGFLVFSFPGLFVASLLVGFSALFARRRSRRFRMRRCGMVLLPLCVALISFLLTRPALRRLLLFAEDVGYLKSMPAKRSLAERFQYLQENVGFDGMWSCVLGYMSPVVPLVPAAFAGVILMFVFSRARISGRAAFLACLLLLSLGLNLLIENLVLIDARRPTFWRYFLIHYGVFVVALSVAIWVCARALARPIFKAIAGVRRVAMSSGSQRFVARGVLCAVAACYLLCGVSVWWSFARRPAKEDLANLAAYLDKRATPFDEIRFQPRWRSLPLRLYRLYADKDICEPRSGVMWHVQYISTDPKPEQMDSVRKFSGLVLWRRGPASLEPEDLYKEFSSKITGGGTFILFGVPRSPGLRRHLRDMLSTRDRVIDFAEDAADDLLDKNAIYMVWDGRSLHNRTDEARTLLSEYSSGLLQLSKIGPLSPNRAVVWESKSTRTLPNGDLEIITTSKPWSLCLSRDSNIPASILKAIRVKLGYFPVNPDREYSDTYRRFSFRETMDLKPGQTETKQEGFNLSRAGRMDSVDIRTNRPPGALYLKTLTISPAHQPQEGDRVIWGGYTLLPKKPAEYLAAHLHL